MTRLVSILLSFLVAATANAYDGLPKEQVSAFFKELASGKTASAVDNLYASNPLMSQKPQQLTMLKQQLGSVSALYGSFLGTENIHTEELSSSLVRIVEVEKHENHPIVWEFYFYKPKDKWIISQGMFLDQFTMVGAKK